MNLRIRTWISIGAACVVLALFLPRCGAGPQPPGLSPPPSPIPSAVTIDVRDGRVAECLGVLRRKYPNEPVLADPLLLDTDKLPAQPWRIEHDFHKRITDKGISGFYTDKHGRKVVLHRLSLTYLVRGGPFVIITQYARTPTDRNCNMLVGSESDMAVFRKSGAGASRYSCDTKFGRLNTLVYGKPGSYSTHTLFAAGSNVVFVKSTNIIRLKDARRFLCLVLNALKTQSAQHVQPRNRGRRYG